MIQLGGKYCGAPMELVRLSEMCLCETYSKDIITETNLEVSQL
jgi:hypothetical protein